MLLDSYLRCIVCLWICKYLSAYLWCSWWTWFTIHKLRQTSLLKRLLNWWWCNLTTKLVLCVSQLLWNWNIDFNFSLDKISTNNRCWLPHMIFRFYSLITFCYILCCLYLKLHKPVLSIIIGWFTNVIRYLTHLFIIQSWLKLWGLRTWLIV